MKIFIGADHAGFELKEKIKKWLLDWGYICEDMGAHKLNPDDDYPDFVSKVAKKVCQNPDESKGILLGRSGQGEAIAANRYKGIRAAVYYGGPKEILKLSREHNNSNILSLGASFIDEKSAKIAIKIWLKTSFSKKARHKRRLLKIENISSKN